MALGGSGSFALSSFHRGLVPRCLEDRTKLGPISLEAKEEAKEDSCQSSHWISVAEISQAFPWMQMTQAVAPGQGRLDRVDRCTKVMELSGMSNCATGMPFNCNVVLDALELSRQSMWPARAFWHLSGVMALTLWAWARWTTGERQTLDTQEITGRSALLR